VREREREGEVGSSLVPRPLPQSELLRRGLGTRLSVKRREREGVYIYCFHFSVNERGVPSPSLLSTAWRKGARECMWSREVEGGGKRRERQRREMKQVRGMWLSFLVPCRCALEGDHSIAAGCGSRS